MTLHHVSVGTNDLNRAQAFYDQVMGVIGLRRIKRSDRLVGYGLTEIIFSLERPLNGDQSCPGNGVHVAFHAGHRSAVDDFHRVGLAHGGTDDGPPGVRAEYDQHYYAAFLRDPDGNKIEVVTFSAN
jgi:catechol 2,3-dioxygenase-like lactoylglutathione lyase family enzyme